MRIDGLEKESMIKDGAKTRKLKTRISCCSYKNNFNYGRSCSNCKNWNRNKSSTLNPTLTVCMVRMFSVFLSDCFA